MRVSKNGVMKTLLRVVVVAGFLGLAACSDGGGSTDAIESQVLASATVIDVRTPEEYAEGHLDGATLIDIKSSTFDDQLAALDPAGSYVVYCRSGNRSAQAVEKMKAAGFTDVTDLGSLEEASAATGIAIVGG